MRIQVIEITNYKAFLGTHKIKVDGKNVFIYGENGSGKSSLYYALKDFFQSSMEDFDLAGLENIFVPQGKEGKTEIKVTFKPNSQGQNKKKAYSWNGANNDARAGSDTSIRDDNKLKSFLTYKHLLSIAGSHSCCWVSLALNPTYVISLAAAADKVGWNKRSVSGHFYGENGLAAFLLRSHRVRPNPLLLICPAQRGRETGRIRIENLFLKSRRGAAPPYPCTDREPPIHLLVTIAACQGATFGYALGRE